MNKHVEAFSADYKEISLMDIWEKLVQYKKVFWLTFFVAFIICSAAVLLTPKKYKFTQMIEVAKFTDAAGRAQIQLPLATQATKIKQVFYPAAMTAHTTRTKTSVSAENFDVEPIGSDILSLSISGEKQNEEKYRIIFQTIIDNLANEDKGYVENYRKSLFVQKEQLKQRLALIKTVRHAHEHQKDLKLIQIYDQNTQAVREINAVKTQLYGISNVKPYSDFVVSDQSVRVPKAALMVLVIIASVFFACFGVFIGNFVSQLRNE